MPPRRTVATVLLLLLALHIYIGVRLIPALQLGILGSLGGVALLILSTLLVPTGLLSPYFKRRRGAEQLAWAGLLAMGLFSSLLVLTFLRELVLLALRFMPAAWSGAWPGAARETALAVPVLAVLVTVVGLFNARRLAHVKHVTIPVPNLPDALNGYTIAQISDIHVGPTIKRKYLSAIVDKVNSLGADAIAITGDLVDGTVARLAKHTAPLARLAAPDGTFFVTGNHEYYSGADAWIAELRRLGVTVLMNQHVVRKRGPASLMIAGVADYTAHHFNPEHKSDPRQAALGAPPGLDLRILLAHQPRSAPAAAEAGFDLQLSGHTHGGQFFPWNLFVPLQQPYVSGLNRLGKMWVYTSRGTGYWGPPKRFGAPSEITLLHLVPM
jgi:predicted MPP superfamily phosphohydrolase